MQGKEFTRYAVYWTPPPGPLAGFGAAWLGWDPASGTAPEALAVEGLATGEITETPRPYGLHATMKAPFRLAEGRTAAELCRAFHDFAARQAPVMLDGLALARLGRFLCLRPEGKAGALDRLAADAVRDLDGFRAPLTEAEIARRRQGGLAPEADALMLHWGYPHVMQRFRFHVTLTGQLDPETMSRAEAALAPMLEPLLTRPFPIDALSLMGEDRQKRFHLIARAPLGDTRQG
ncbi:DUF1045 domain-containing protein [Roseovarius aquimarinus]|uniref:DUF1045 domain-containing protein n=1 Tax=Roseovarius aquimarinus TaxID=1229156 RepID=A0ABW7I9X2_9RHOB